MKNILFSLATAEKSLFEELWDYFVQNYLDTGAAYSNLGFGGNSLITMPVILFGLFIGFIASTVALIYDKRVLGAFVKKMLSEGAVGKEKATTLYHLGYTERSTVGRSLRKGVNLRRVVHCVEEEDYYAKLKKNREEYEKKREEDRSLPPFKEVSYTHVEGEHFYIPEDKKHTAEAKFAGKAVSWLTVPIVIAVSLVGFFVLMVVLPYMLTLLDQLIGSFKSV